MTSHTSTPGDPTSQEDSQSQTRGPQIVSISIADGPESWAAAGFTVDASGSCRLGSMTIELVGGGGGVVGWTFDPNPPGGDLDGIPLVAKPSDSADRPRGAGSDLSNINGIVAVDHVVVNSDDSERSTAVLETAGFPARHGRTTTSYGAPMQQTFFWAGEVILELVGPAEGEPTNAGPSTIFGLALVAADLDETARQLGDLLGSPKAAVQEGRLIAGLRGKEVGISVPIAVMSPHLR